MRLTPLCPAGHLPLKGGRSICGKVSHISKLASEAMKEPLADLPLEGEMPGRAEGVSSTRLRVRCE